MSPSSSSPTSAERTVPASSGPVARSATLPRPSPTAVSRRCWTGVSSATGGRDGVRGAPTACRRSGVHAEHEIEHVPRVADERGPVAQQRVGAVPSATRAPGPGTAPTSRPRSSASSAVMSEPDRSRGLDHDRHVGKRRDDPVAGREAPAPDGLPGRQLRDDHAVVGDERPCRARRLAADRATSAPPPSTATVRPTALERSGVRGAVDAQRHPADDGDAGRGKAAPEGASDLKPFRRRPSASRRSPPPEGGRCCPHTPARRSGPLAPAAARCSTAGADRSSSSRDG